MNVRFTLQASAEVERSAIHYDIVSGEVGTRFLARLAEAIELLGTNASTFPRVEDGHGGRDIRLLSIARFPLWLIYELTEDEVVVLALWHGQRPPEDWSQRRA